MFACSVNAVFTVFAGFGVVNRVRLCSRVRGFANTTFNCVRVFACSLNAYVRTIVFAERVFAVRAATKRTKGISEQTKPISERTVF